MATLHPERKILLFNTKLKRVIGTADEREEAEEFVKDQPDVEVLVPMQPVPHEWCV